MTEYYVAFPEWEWQRLVALGCAIQANHESTDRDSMRTQDDENHEHVLGTIGQQAFGYIADLKPDETLRRDGDHLIDFQFGPFTLDVKSRSQEHYAMLIKQSALKTTHHCYVHCWVNQKTRVVRFWGWLPGKEVPGHPLRPARNPTLPFQNYEIEPEQSARRDIKDLLALIEKHR